jgi:pimeloyl-ACP methyl ester carboxylesterase
MNAQRKSSRRAGLGSSAERRRRVVPLAVQLSGIGFNLLSRLHNDLAAKWLTRLWFTTFKSRPGSGVEEFWRGAERRVEIAVEETGVAVHCWGQGPRVVLMHGWSGSGSQFRDFIEPLVEAGFTAVCFDAPEHGSDSGKQTHMLRFSATLLSIQRELGSIDTIVAHSLGAMASLYTQRLGLRFGRAVLIAPQLDAQILFDGYRDLLRLRPALARRTREMIGARLRELLDEADPWEVLRPDRLLGETTVPGLLVYDRGDPEVPLEHFQDILDQWKQGTAFETAGLGHNRILRDPAAIDAVVGYLRD